MANNGAYDKALLHLQEELVKMQQWVREEGQRVVIVIEGRDAAGKGGVIKRITEYLNPRWCRIAALPAPSDREEGQWYFQRYIAHLPAGGEIVLFDRSWYNRAGVERVMGFCTDEEYHRFLRQCPAFERMLIDDGIILLKYWFSVSDEEQERRFKERINDPLKRWKLSEMDLEGRNRWVAYSRAKDEMFATATSRTPPGTRSRPTTRSGPGSTALLTSSRSCRTTPGRLRRSSFHPARLSGIIGDRPATGTTTCPTTPRRSAEGRKAGGGQAARKPDGGTAAGSAHGSLRSSESPCALRDGASPSRGCESDRHRWRKASAPRSLRVS